MARIGGFFLREGDFPGPVRIPSTTVNSHLAPKRNMASDSEPDFRRYAGGAEPGAAGRQESRGGKPPYLAARPDDMSFARPIRATSLENEAEGAGVMMWSRAKAG